MHRYINENRTDNLPRLWQENTIKYGKYSFEKLSSVLSKIQARNTHQRKGFADNRHSKAGTGQSQILCKLQFGCE